MSSFYGGKEGRTYNIVQRYDSVAQMVEAFSGGGAYTGANYGLYVIIDTIMNLNHKSDLENGLLYRRGFDYNDAATNHPKPDIEDSKYYDVNNNFLENSWQKDWASWVNNPGGGAIYIGQIVGPQGDTSLVVLTNWDKIRDNIPEGIVLDPKTHKIVPTSRTKGNDTTTIRDDDGNTIWEGDAIKAVSVTMRDTDGNVIGARLAFDIPEEVFVISAQSVDAYGDSTRKHFDSISGKNDTVSINATQDATTKEWKYTNLIHLHSKSGVSAGHPFYHNLDIAIPKGIHGRDIEEFTKETVEEINLDVPASERIEIDNINVFSGDLYITYTTRDYQRNAAGIITTHQGRWPYRVIDHIDLINSTRNIITWRNGVLVKVGDLYRVNSYILNMYWVCTKAGHIIINSEASDSLPNITSASQVGQLITSLQETEWRAINIPTTTPAHSIFVDYTAGADKTFENALRNVDHLSVDKDGNLYAFYSDDLSLPYYLTNIGGLKTGSVEGELGVVLTDKDILFNFTNGTTLKYPLKQILSIDFKVGTPQKNEDGSWKYDENNKLVFDSDELDSKLKIRYKDGTQEEPYEIKRIESINYDNQDLTENQNITVTYKGDLPVTINTSPIDMVRAITKKGDNVYVLYANPVTRNAIEQNGVEGKDWIKIDWVDPITNISYTRANNNVLVWKNFNSLDGQAQYHVYGEVTYNDLTAWLEQGFRDFTEDPVYSLHGDLSGKAGWLVTVNDASGPEIVKRIYAFDYNNDNHLIPGDTSSHWYEIFSLTASQINPELSIIIDTLTYDALTESYIPSNYQEPLLTNMIWFVESYGHDNY